MTEQQWAEIRRLFFEEKFKKRGIARHLALHPDTVARAVAADTFPRRDSPSRGSLVDAFEEPIRGLLDRFPDLSGVRLFEELQKLGYTGRISILRDRLRELRPRRQPEVFLRRETLPGEEAQADWGSCGMIQTDNVVRPLSVFVMVLSFSRLLYVEFTVSQEMEDFLRCHVNAFRFFGGYPKTILYDNLRSVVAWRQQRFTRLNARFQEFTGTYRFEARPCNPGRGNEKPRAEVGVRYVKQNFLAGRSFTNLQEIQIASAHWLREVANVRTHGTTGERPVDRFLREKERLHGLPAAPYDTRICRDVYVNHQARVSFQNNTYSVPPAFVGQELVLKAAPERVFVYDKDREVASHRRAYGRYRDTEDPAHGRAICLHKRKGHLDKQRDEFSALGSAAERFLQGLVERGHGSPALHVERLLALVESHGKTEVLGALEHAMRYGAFGAEYVENILRQRLGRRQPSANALELSTRPDLARHQVEAPDWKDYAHLGELEEHDDEKD